MEAWADDRDPDAQEDLQAEFGRWSTEVGALGAVPPGKLKAYYPRALDRTLDLVASTLVLIICFLPFVLAAPSFIREKEAHTLEILLSAPGIDAPALVTGKSLFVVVVALAELLLLVVLAQSLYGIHVKPGFLTVPLLFLPAILSTALLGLAVSALAVTQAQVGLASALYFLAITLLTGFLVPLDEASGLVRGLSQLFPLTLVRPAFRSWTLGAEPQGLPEALAGLWIQCGVYGAFCLAAVRQALRRI
jgi:ABC-type multidrug transport system permease subunit